MKRLLSWACGYAVFMVRYCHNAGRCDKGLNNGNVRWCRSMSVGVPGVVKLGRPVCQCVTWAVLDGI